MAAQRTVWQRLQAAAGTLVPETVAAMPAEALAEEEVTVEHVEITDNGTGGAELTVELVWKGEQLSVTVEIM
mgnify:CR=1 FL=1